MFSSQNLIDWTQVGDTGQAGCGQCWAPNFMTHKGKFYLSFTDGATLTSSIAVADRVTGPYKVTWDRGIPGIDPYVLEFEGTCYCFYNPIKRGAIMACVPLNASLTGPAGTSKDLFVGPLPGLNQRQPTVEAPVCVAVGSMLYLIFSVNATGPDYNLSYCTALHPMGPWKQSGMALLPDDKSGHGHCDVVRAPDGGFAMVYHGAAWVNGGRNLCIDKINIGNGQVTVKYTGQGRSSLL